MAREKIVTNQSKRFLSKEQRLKDREARVAMKKGGGHMAMHAAQHTAEAERAEVASHKLNKRTRF